MGVERLSLNDDLERQFTSIPEGGSKVFIKPKGREGILVTLRAMRFFVEKDKTNPEFIKFVHNIIREVPQRDKINEARTIYDWVKKNFRYEKDPSGVEMVIRPYRNLKEFAGSDCDCQAAFISSCLEIIGIPARFVAIATNKSNGKFVHVYSEGFIGNKWVPIDTASTITGFGDEYRGITEKMYWPEYGQKGFLSYLHGVLGELNGEVNTIHDLLMNTASITLPSMKDQVNQTLASEIVNKGKEMMGDLMGDGTNVGILALIAFGLIYMINKGK